MTIPDPIVSDIVSSIASILNGAMPLIVILFAIGIAFFLVRNLISLLPKG
jgi:hypothetical protein